jgi:hypothetical protein
MLRMRLRCQHAGRGARATFVIALMQAGFSFARFDRNDVPNIQCDKVSGHKVDLLFCVSAVLPAHASQIVAPQRVLCTSHLHPPKPPPQRNAGSCDPAFSHRLRCGWYLVYDAAEDRIGDVADMFDTLSLTRSFMSIAASCKASRVSSPDRGANKSAMPAPRAAPPIKPTVGATQ